MEEPRNPIVAYVNGQTEMVYYLIVNANGSIIEV
jgi:hypothetical protein